MFAVFVKFSKGKVRRHDGGTKVSGILRRSYLSHSRRCHSIKSHLKLPMEAGGISSGSPQAQGGHRRGLVVIKCSQMYSDETQAIMIKAGSEPQQKKLCTSACIWRRVSGPWRSITT